VHLCDRRVRQTCAQRSVFSLQALAGKSPSLVDVSVASHTLVRSSLALWITQGSPAVGMDITVDFGQVMAAFDSSAATSDGTREATAGKRTAKSAAVYDVWGRKQLGSFAGTFTATNVPHHGTAFLRLTPKGLAD
jgi:hypothetical protein